MFYHNDQGLNKKLVQQLLDEAKASVDSKDITTNVYEKFCELIVRECIHQAHNVALIHGANDDMIYGGDVAAGKIAKHFGVR
jgi:hypothetical protein